MTPQPFIVPADVYDVLELSAEAHGGVGAGNYYDLGVTGHVPLCIIGHAQFLGDYEIEQQLREAFSSAGRNGSIALASDDVVLAALSGPADLSARIPFQTWAERMGCVRGDA